MKKIILSVIILLITITQIQVNAANYEMKELIPVDIETTIVNGKFSYKGLYYNAKKEDGDKSKRNYIIFRGIKNISDEARPVSISIALFGEDRLNIGMINFCTGNLNPGEEIPYEIEAKKEYFGEDFKASDVKYISVISENLNCRTTGADEFIGDTVDEIGMMKNNVITTPIHNTLLVFGIVGGVVFFLFIYAFMFTGQYTDMNGDDTRRAFKYQNKKLKEKREMHEMLHPTVEPEKPKEKTDEVLQQEEYEKNRDKTDTDLHNMYK